MLALRFVLVIIFSGPFAPKFNADAFVASEKVGEGGPGDAVRLVGAMARDWRERARGIVFQPSMVSLFEVCNVWCGSTSIRSRRSASRIYLHALCEDPDRNGLFSAYSLCNYQGRESQLPTEGLLGDCRSNAWSSSTTYVICLSSGRRTASKRTK